MPSLAYSFFHHSNDEAQSIEEEMKFESVNIPSSYKSSNSAARTNSDEIDDMTFEVTVTSPEGIESTGYGRMIFIGDQSISSFELTSNIFEETGINSNFWVDAVGDFSNGRTAEEVCNCSGLKKGGGKRQM